MSRVVNSQAQFDAALRAFLVLDPAGRLGLVAAILRHAVVPVDLPEVEGEVLALRDAADRLHEGIAAATRTRVAYLGRAPH